MRFLWVEDFNEDKGDRAALETRWKEYFGLDEVIIKEDLKSAHDQYSHKIPVCIVV